MIAVLSVELRKLNRSLAAVLVLAAPSLIGFFTFFVLLRNKHPSSWENLLQASTGIWAFFMLPMSVTALTALVAQMEHAPRAWDHLRALPVARWKLYAAKAICVVALVAVMTLLNQLIAWAAISGAAALKPAVAPTGALDVSQALLLNGKIVAAALLMIAIQLWAALRFSSFVPALALGIGGTFFSVVATSAKQGVFFPWQMPMNMLARDAWRVETALALGGGLGLLALIVAVLHLARREVL
ncbi:ABC transporter permease [Caulobacter sp. BP25]|uniref:ABC transporter permease n=1 Tax=Caulobacter sp. BP25 TaxID=2048900 RepID=UPI000C12BA64|nr:ABC transporter permease [Caulobacter sp. BP25]PHY18248.1 ABC transporter [Caulobacter sp. BP25]